jgi:hypothetical protein
VLAVRRLGPVVSNSCPPSPTKRVGREVPDETPNSYGIVGLVAALLVSTKGVAEEPAVTFKPLAFVL